MKRAALISTKPPKCPVCKRRTADMRSRVHSECVDLWIARQIAKQDAARKKRAAEAKKLERADTKRRKEALMTTRQLLPLVQDDFNAYIRARDRDKGCFVCGKPFPTGRLGGDFDAGHVRSRGAAKHLRFNEDNCHGECKECNASWGAKPHQIEAGAIRRIGQERFDALKANNTPHKWTRDELIGLRAEYRAKLKALKEASQ